MKITFDPNKRDGTLLERGLDFADAAKVFAGRTYTQEDLRTDYGERRFQTIGFLHAEWSWSSGHRAVTRGTSFR